jgi:hypothetical protein
MESITVQLQPPLQQPASPPRQPPPKRRRVYVDPYTMSKYIEEISLSIGSSRVLRV